MIWWFEFSFPRYLYFSPPFLIEKVRTFDLYSNQKQMKTVKSFVLMSLEKYNSFKETEYLLDSEKHRTRLLDSIKKIESGIVQEHDLIEI